MLLGAFLGCARYGPIGRFAYFWIAPGSSGRCTLPYVSLKLIMSWYALGTLRLIRILMLDPVLAIVAVGRLMEID